MAVVWDTEVLKEEGLAMSVDLSEVTEPFLDWGLKPPKSSVCAKFSVLKKLGMRRRRREKRKGS